MNTATVRLLLSKQAEATLDEDAEEQSAVLRDAILDYLQKSDYVFTADLLMTIVGFQVQAGNEMVAVLLKGQLNDSEFEESWTYVSDGFGVDHSAALLHPGHWLTALLARSIVNAGDSTSPRQKSISQITAQGTLALTDAIDQATGSPGSEFASQWKSMKTGLWLVYGCCAAGFAALFLIREFGNPAHPPRHSDDPVIVRILAGVVVGALAGLIPAAACFFAALLRLPAEQIGSDATGKSLMAMVGVRSVGSLRSVSAFAMVVLGIAAVAAYGFMITRVWSLPF